MERGVGVTIVLLVIVLILLSVMITVLAYPIFSNLQITTKSPKTTASITQPSIYVVDSNKNLDAPPRVNTNYDNYYDYRFDRNYRDYRDDTDFLCKYDTVCHSGECSVQRKCSKVGFDRYRDDDCEDDFDDCVDDCDDDYDDCIDDCEGDSSCESDCIDDKEDCLEECVDDYEDDC